MQETINEELHLEVIIDGEEWECWVLNSDKLNASVYSNFGFNSFCSNMSGCYGANAEGIFLLEGEEDYGKSIRPGIILPSSSFDKLHDKRFRKGFFGISGKEPTIKAITDSGERVFSVVTSEVTFRRDQKGRKWSFLLQDFEELDFIELFPVVMSR